MDSAGTRSTRHSLRQVRGVSMEMTSQTYHRHLEELIEQGSIDESVIDQLVLEILGLKFRLGLFEKPYAEVPSPSVLFAEDHLELARRMAQQSMVLLKNERQVLPLDRNKIRKLAVIGPLADAKRDQLGTWIPDGQEASSRTPLMAIREALEGSVEILFAPGLAEDLVNDSDSIANAAAIAKGI